MLSFLRENASGWFTKIMFGGIALIFALYFGFSAGGPPAGGTAPIAKVNGENIPVARLNQAVEGQLEVYQQLNTNQGQDFRQLLETQILQGMIRNSLFAQEANRLGIRITDQALADAIRSNPSFAQDGQFNEDFYLNQFKPFFERSNGENYEYALGQEMLAKRLQEALTQGAVVSNAQLDAQLKLQNTQVSFEKLTIPTTGGDPAEALQVAKLWIAAKQSGQTDPELLKTKDLKVETLDQSLDQLLSTLPQPILLPVLKCLVKNNPGEACADPFASPEGVTAFYLISRTASEEPETAAKREAVASQLLRTKQNQILEAAANNLVEHAKIETFLVGNKKP